MQKLIIAHIEANKDGKPHYYQHVKLKYCLHKKRLHYYHVAEIVKSIVECFDTHYGKTTPETSEAAASVHMEERGCLLLHIS